jgi:hypothetical protein
VISSKAVAASSSAWEPIGRPGQPDRGDQTTLSSETLRSISTPEQLETRLGALDFIDGGPSPATSELVDDHLDYVHALNVFRNGAGASTVALRKGLAEAGADDNQVLSFSELSACQARVGG